MDFLLAFLSIFIAIALFHLFRSLTSPSINLPPGPTPLPIIGNFLQLRHQPHQSLAKLAQIHGPILTLQLGQVTTIVISSPSLAKEILKVHDLNFCNRKVPEAAKGLNHHEAGMAWVPVSSRWRNMRKICNSTIFAAQKLDANQDLRHKKVHELLQLAERRCLVGEAMDIGEAAFNTTINLLSNTIFSVDLADAIIDHDSKSGFRNVVRSLMGEVATPNLADYNSLFRMVDPQGIKRRASFHLGQLFDFFDRILNERMEMRKKGRSRRVVDVLDTLLDICEDDGQMLNIHDLKHLFMDLFIAGSDTTSTTLEWAMAELLSNPNTLSKLQTELEHTIGKGNLVKESDIQHLQYLQAVVKETFRLRPAAPILFPRHTSADVEIIGFTVPKDAQVLVNAWAIGRDATLWEEPNCFQPERFLVSSIDFKGKDFSLIPFGSGRRICPGIPLATRMLHLMLGSLINSFDWKLESGETVESLDMEERYSGTLRKSQPVRVIPVRFS